MAKEKQNLIGDPEYQDLLDSYQEADFEKCNLLLQKLEKRYPENQEIIKFKEDLLIKLSFKSSIDSVASEEKRRKKKKVIKMTLFAVIAAVTLTAIFLFIYFLFGVNKRANQLEENAILLSSLEYQAEKLLDAGKPQPAADIVERMQAIDESYEQLPELGSRTERLLQLEESYQTALSLVEQDRKDEALDIFKEIDEQEPNMWDIQYQIGLIETEIQVASSIEEGSRAFLSEDWDTVISAYEKALELDPRINDQLIQEQLIQGYLNKIISLLEKDTTTIDDIDDAERYYRHALSLVSQNREFAGERESLQQASGDLLQLKYSQVAKDALRDKNQTPASVAEAVSFMRKATNIAPENKALNEDLKYAEYYQMAYRNFLDMKWDQAITYLNYMQESGPNYADENANILLYESYYALGKQYASYGLYLDAVNVLEKAELITWSDTDNLLKLFQVQVLLGDVFGLLGNFDGAVSYYRYALDVVEADRKLTDYPDLSKTLSDANIQAAYFHFRDAFPAYQEVLEDIDVIYTRKEVEIEDSVCLAFFAAENQSTVDVLIEENNLPKNMSVTFGRKLTVPSLEN